MIFGVILFADGGGLVALAAGFGFGFGRAVMPLSRYLSDQRHAWDARLESQLQWIVPASTAMCAVGVLVAGSW